MCRCVSSLLCVVVAVVVWLWLWSWCVCVCGVVWHAENPVCTFKTSPCVPAPRAHVLKHVCAWCRYTRGRFECTHGGVSESTHGAPHHVGLRLEQQVLHVADHLQGRCLRRLPGPVFCAKGPRRSLYLDKRGLQAQVELKRTVRPRQRLKRCTCSVMKAAKVHSSGATGFTFRPLMASR